jgi:hypothetical protein
VIDAQNDPANPSARESPIPSSTGSLVSDIDAMPTKQDPPGKTSSPEQEMKDMPGMKGMNGMKDMPAMGSNTMASPAKTIYTCPMHLEVQQDQPGKCPKCGMTLVVKKTGTDQ